MKLITFTVPCYNSAAYMDRCVETLLPAGEEAEIILVDDGSKDDTGKIADAYAEKYPNIVKVIHQENGGHGEGVNQGIRNASGMYFKVVDSDDWLDAEALQKIMQTLRGFAAMEQPVDLLMCNYVYEHVVDNTHHTVSYKSILPQDRVFAWDEIGRFPPSQNILMHTVIYRTQILRDSGLELPKHTFYVDNVFVYQPLPLCQRLYYMDIDLYRYFIGRDDQSVNERDGQARGPAVARDQDHDRRGGSVCSAGKPEKAARLHVQLSVHDDGNLQRVPDDGWPPGGF